MKLVDIIKKHFKIEVYHSRHRSTGYEMCISNDGDSAYCEITEEEYNLLKEKVVK